MQSISLTEHEEWKHIRLPNWGRSQWAALMASGPDSSCANPIYDMGPAGDPDGYADDADTAAADRAPVVIDIHSRQELPPVDEADAEIVGAWIAQLPRGHRMVLCRKYILRDRIGVSYIDAAIRAVLDIKLANRRATDRIRAILGHP